MAVINEDQLPRAIQLIKWKSQRIADFP